MLRTSARLLPILIALSMAGCASVGPPSLEQTRLQYNEAIKRTTEEQLLLNIVRLRYTDTPSSLAVSAIAAQFERSQSAALLPFFTAAGSDINRSFTTVLPQFQVTGADRPTITLTPLDDQEFTRKLFTPIPLDGVIYLAKTTWPISKVFRLYLENVNWVPNAQSASGPTPRHAPPASKFLAGMEALQALQDRGSAVFGTITREETVGDPLPPASVTARDQIEAARSDLSYRRSRSGTGWELVRLRTHPVLRIDPAETTSTEYATLITAFHLRAGITEFEITQEAMAPFRSQQPAAGNASIDLETRSLLQALYYVSHGVEVPAAHLAGGHVTETLDAEGRSYDWRRWMAGLFTVRSGTSPPPGALVAVRYKDHWFWIDETDSDTKSTFSLLVELSRLELNARTGTAPQLTLPLGR